ARGSLVGLPPRRDEAPLVLGHAFGVEQPSGPALDRARRLGRYAEELPNLGYRPARELVVIDLEEIDAVALAHDFAAPNRVRDALVHARRPDVVLAHVAVEEAGARDVARLEQTDQRREPREAFRVGI